MRAVGVVLISLALLGGDRSAGAEGPASTPPGPPAVDLAARTRALEERAKAWWSDRRKLVGSCPQCIGSGKVRWRRQWMDCPKCDGRKRYVPPDVYRRLFYEVRSPAFRLMDGIRDKVEAAYKEANGSAWPMDVNRFRIERVVLVDPTRGEAWVAENDDTTARPQRWIWAEEKGKGSWWLWDEGADGAWPSAASAAPAAEAAGAPLSLMESADLEAAFKGLSTLGHTLAGAARTGSTLLLTLDTKPVGGGIDLNARATPDLRSIGKALWSGPSPWSEIRWTFRARYRDRFGGVEPRAYLTARILRADFERIRWENLTPEEQLALFAPENPAHEGWTLWRQE